MRVAERDFPMALGGVLVRVFFGCWGWEEDGGRWWEDIKKRLGQKREGLVDTSRKEKGWEVYG